jgi:hypothetical protein
VPRDTSATCGGQLGPPHCSTDKCSGLGRLRARFSSRHIGLSRAIIFVARKNLFVTAHVLWSWRSHKIKKQHRAERRCELPSELRCQTYWESPVGALNVKLTSEVFTTRIKWRTLVSPAINFGRCKRRRISLLSERLLTPEGCLNSVGWVSDAYVGPVRILCTEMSTGVYCWIVTSAWYKLVWIQFAPVYFESLEWHVTTKANKIEVSL